MEVCMDFIGLIFVASVLSLSTAHFVETFRTHRPKHDRSTKASETTAIRPPGSERWLDDATRLPARTM